MESGLTSPLHPLRAEMTVLEEVNWKRAPRDVLWSLMVGQPTTLISLLAVSPLSTPYAQTERQWAWQAHSDFIFCPRNRQIRVSVAVAVAQHPPPADKWHLWLLEEDKETGELGAQTETADTQCTLSGKLQDKDMPRSLLFPICSTERCSKQKVQFSSVHIKQ